MELMRTGGGFGGASVAVMIEPGRPLALAPIIGIGRNYAEHAKEQGLAPPDSIVAFTKNPAAACLNGDDIVVPAACQDPKTGGDQVDFEGELAVIIGPGPTGAGARDVPKARAMQCVLGYCIANDVSARWWQKQGSGGQFFRGKSFDTFCPLGPRVVPAGEVPDPAKLRLTTRVNGVVMQDASTGDMTFEVATLISELSRGLTLTPGTVILTGTPSGVGMSRTPPTYLKHGDEVRITIDGLGTLVNRVRFEGR